MKFFNERLKKIKKKTRNYLIYTIIFLGLGVLCFGWAYYISETTKDTGITLHELIYKGSTKEKEIVELTVTERPYVFAEYDDILTSPKYYFLMDDDYLYVGYLDYETYQKLNQEDINENPVTIKGVTKKIPSDVIDIAIEVYNEDLGEEFLTKGNYKSYIGEICIDTASDLVDNLFQIILGIIFIITSLIYLIIYFYRNAKIKKIQKDTTTWDKVKNELEKDNVIDYSKFGLFLTENYIVDGLKGLTLIPYKDIVWVYLHEHKYNGITCNRYLMVVTNNKKKIMIAGLNGLHPKAKNTYLEIMEKIYEKNKNILIGFTKENQKQIKDLYQIK